ncbi:MAG: DUF3311 domain-containing protein [Chloroflexota bacterium]|nr:MAG: DUF3311 domain-containing protein [Chloroflexota bacterium]
MITRRERGRRSWLLLGIPFFYWFQLLWIIITAILTAVLYALRV